MSDGQTGQDADWSDRHAETGGWPPPAPDQRRYGPGTPGAGAPSDPTAPPGGGWDRATGPASGGPWDQPANDPETRWGQPADQRGQPADQRGQPADQRGQPATQWGQPADQWGQVANGAPDAQPVEPVEPGAPWAPGDPAYGRLSGAGRTQRQPPRRPWDNRPQQRRPVRRSGSTPVTIGLIAINVFVFLLQQADPTITVRYGLVPLFVENGQYERLITSAFLHANFLHLATNMLTLYIVGAPLERVLRTGRYLTVYLLSALGGSLLSLWLSPAFSNGVGASGAIFGLFGALVVLRRQVGAQAGGLVMLIGLNLVISFTVPNISWQAHIGGLVTGTLVAVVFDTVDRARRRRRDTG